MIIAIERNKFTYLYKYNEIRVDVNQVIDKSIESLKRMIQTDIEVLAHTLNKAIPLFEQDHEIILIEVDKNKIKFHDGIMLSFDSINFIYPLTKIGGQLLEGKISDDFIVELPVFEKGIDALKINRSMEFRSGTSEKLLAHFNLTELLNKEMLSLIESSVKKNLIDKTQPQVFTTFLDHLIAYNKTPSFIPDGNIEYICKIGAIAIKYLGKPEEVFTNGPFYKSCLKYKSIINNKSYSASYLAFISIADDELKTSYEKMVELISKDYKDVDIFKVSYFFLAFKSFINKNDNNIEGISHEILALINQDRNTAAFVLSLLGYTFSMENIYEGIHRLSNAPLLKSTQRKKAAEIEMKKREFVEIERKKERERKAIEQEKLISKKDKFLLDVEIKNNETERVPISSTEKNEKVFVPSSVENVSEPIVIYEVIAKQEVQENDKSIDYNEIKNDLKRIDPIDQNDAVSDKESLTVQVFRSYLSNEVAKAKQKIWFQFLDYFFPIKNEELSFENLEKLLDTKPEVKEKLLKTKKEKELLKAFFDTYK